MCRRSFTKSARRSPVEATTAQNEDGKSAIISARKPGSRGSRFGDAPDLTGGAPAPRRRSLGRPWRLGARACLPRIVKLALDYSLLTMQEMMQFRALIEKAMPRQTEGSEPLEAAADEQPW